MKARKTAERRDVVTLGTGKDRAAEVGTTIRTKIERGDRYSAPEVYNLEIAICEVLRGKGALEHLRMDGVSKLVTKVGFELVLVRVRFGFFSKGRRFGHQREPYEITKGCFVAVSPDGNTEYEIPIMKRQPQPPLINMPFMPGDVKEGWVALQVPEGEERALLIFKRDYSENAYGFWGPVWFQLFSL